MHTAATLAGIQPMPRRSTYRPPDRVQELDTSAAFGDLTAENRLKAPPLLFVVGDVTLLRAPRRVAIVGSRDVSPEGQARARKLARLLAQAGVVVVSGLARGVDRAAHEAALAAGGRTIAVIGTSIEKAYPAEHADLQERIYREHLLVSQFPPSRKVFPSNFIERNRTMALLSHASVIVEAGDTSGSLSQAAETQRLGKALFIMKSVLDDTSLLWPPKFISKGAIALEDVSQVLDVLAGR